MDVSKYIDTWQFDNKQIYKIVNTINKKDLTQDEIQRAGKYYFKKDRERFLAIRYALRKILSHKLKCEPQKIDIKFNQYCKPIIDSEYGVYFNISHTSGRSIIVISNELIGVDIENIQTLPKNIVRRPLYSYDEMNMLNNISTHSEYDLYVAALWTAKEAMAKAIGTGIRDMNQISISRNDSMLYFSRLPRKYDPNEWIIMNLISTSSHVAKIVSHKKFTCHNLRYFDCLVN